MTAAEAAKAAGNGSQGLLWLEQGPCGGRDALFRDKHPCCACWRSTGTRSGSRRVRTTHTPEPPTLFQTGLEQTASHNYSAQKPRSLSPGQEILSVNRSLQEWGPRCARPRARHPASSTGVGARNDDPSLPFFLSPLSNPPAPSLPCHSVPLVKPHCWCLSCSGLTDQFPCQVCHLLTKPRGFLWALQFLPFLSAMSPGQSWVLPSPKGWDATLTSSFLPMGWLS